MILRLSVRPSDKSKLILGYALPGRLLYLGIATFFAIGMMLLKEAPLPLAMITLITALAGLYEEQWVFDHTTGHAIRNRGIGPAAKRTVLPLNSLKSLVLRVVSSPSPEESPKSLGADPVIPEALRKGRAVLLLVHQPVDKSGTRNLVLEDGSHREREALEGLGRAIADYCGIPLYT
jgi:hypothetical protein